MGNESENMFPAQGGYPVSSHYASFIRANSRIRVWAVPEVGTPECINVAMATLDEAIEFANLFLGPGTHHIRVDIEMHGMVVMSVNQGSGWANALPKAPFVENHWK